MNNGDLYDIVLMVLKKESRGNIIKPDRFSDLLKQCHYEYYNQQYEKWAGSQLMIDSLRPFLAIDESVSFTTGSALISSLSHTYKHLSSARPTSSGKATIVSDEVWNEWANDVVMKGSAEYPLLTIDGTNLKVLPTSVTTLLVSYLRKATNEPFFDYYTDANYSVKYLTDGQEYTLQTGEVYRDGTTSGTVTSISKELEWEDFDKINIVSMMLEKLGVSMQAPDVTQYAMALEQKQNVM